MKYTDEPHYKEIIHSSKWKRIRYQYLKDHPVCEYPNCSHLAEEIHHRIPLNRYRYNLDEMYNKAFDENNLEALCHEHHNLRHIELEKSKTRDVQGRNKEKVNDFINNWLNIKNNDIE